MIRLTNRGWTVGSITRRIRICAINTPSATINWRANISAATGVKRGVGNIGTTATGVSEPQESSDEHPRGAIVGVLLRMLRRYDISPGRNSRSTTRKQPIRLRAECGASPLAQG